MQRLVALGFVLVFALATPSARAAVDVERVVSPGGIEAWLVENHANPILSMTLAFRGGSAVLDTATRPGTTELLSGMMNEGAGPYDSQAFQKALEEHSIDFSFENSRSSLLR